VRSVVATESLNAEGCDWGRLGRVGLLTEHSRALQQLRLCSSLRLTKRGQSAIHVHPHAAAVKLGTEDSFPKAFRDVTGPVKVLMQMHFFTFSLFLDVAPSWTCCPNLNQWLLIASVTTACKIFRALHSHKLTLMINPYYYCFYYKLFIQNFWIVLV
jgi:hypothetical protein